MNASVLDGNDLPMPSRKLALSCAALLAVLASIASPALAQEVLAQDTPRVSEVVRSVELAASRVQRLLAEARASEEPTRVSCVDGRLSEIHSLLRLSLERSDRVHRAERAGDRELVLRESALIRRLATRARSLERDARACIDPDPAFGSDRTQVTVIIEPWVPGDEAMQPLSPAPRGALAP